jgi:hypothetical protein
MLISYLTTWPLLLSLRNLQALATAEGVVRKIRKALPRCDLAMVYITTDALAQEYDLDKGAVPEIMQIYERLADHYGIPSIHLGLDIVKKAHVGGVIWSWGKWGLTELPQTEDAHTAVGDKYVFGSDGVHPHAFTGCKAYCDAVDRSIAELEKSSTVPYPFPPKPLDPHNYEEARWVMANDASVSQGVKKVALDDPLAEGRPDVAAHGYIAQRPGDTFTLDFYGSTVGVYMLVGPFSGDLNISIDGRPGERKEVFGTFTYKVRRGFYILYDGLSQTNHSLVVDIAPEVPDKSSILETKERQIELEYANRTDAVVLAFGYL